MTPTRRSYGDRCGIARALDLVGDRWALLVVRELLLGPKRFTDLRAALPGVSPDVLTQRLRDLEQADVLRPVRLPPPAPVRAYELTERGHELEPVILALGRWGSAVPLAGDDAVFTPDSAMLALKTMFDPAAAEGLDATYELRLADQVFAARVSGGELTMARGPAGQPDATLETDTATLAELAFLGRDLAAATKAGAVAVGGDARLVRRLLRVFRAR